MKLSLFNSDDDREETVELDDELAGKLREVVDATPDLTMADALRQGVQHVVDKGRVSGGTSS
jgi:predicted transcriptional regulator